MHTNPPGRCGGARESYRPAKALHRRQSSWLVIKTSRIVAGYQPRICLDCSVYAMVPIRSVFSRLTLAYLLPFFFALTGGLCPLALPGGQCPPGPALSWGLSCGLLGWLLWGSAVACVLARALWEAVFIALHILPVAHSLFHRFGCFPHGPFSSLRTFCRSSSSVPPPYPARFPGCLPLHSRSRLWTVLARPTRFPVVFPRSLSRLRTTSRTPPRFPVRYGFPPLLKRAHIL